MTKKFFHFISSIRLAVPLMLVILVVIAYGTFVESRYNADIAKIQVYASPWFTALMILLWINIFTSTISRWPFQKKHIGFVTVHTGLLTLLLGGMITGIWGIDGTLRLVENEQGRTVVLPDLVLKLSPAGSKTGIEYPLPRTMNSLDSKDLENLNSQIGSLLKVSHLEPFVEIKNTNRKSSGPPREPFVINFHLKSDFFDVEQTLHSQEQSQLQMGPATLRLVKSDSSALRNQALNTNRTQNRTSAKIANREHKGLLVKNRQTGAEIINIPTSSLKVGSKVTITDSITIEITKVLRNALVGAQGGLVDDERKEGQENPALEIKITKSGKSIRDVVYAKFPNFSLNQEDQFNLTFEYRAEISTSAAPSPNHRPGRANNNEIEFHYSLDAPETLTAILLKGGQKIQESLIKEGETLQTPWMGMQIILNQISWGEESFRQVVPTKPRPQQSILPPSAIYLVPKDSAPADEAWLVEGEQIRATLNDQDYTIYFGRRMIDLPFQIELQKFSKIDYPGTNTAKSFESHISVPELHHQQVISMNEPLVQAGYTIYQASYEQLPNGQFASVFSVNKDPGRPLKYLGGLILSLGIIIFTLMRSQWYRKRGGL